MSPDPERAPRPALDRQAIIEAARDAIAKHGRSRLPPYGGSCSR